MYRVTDKGMHVYPYACRLSQCSNCVVAVCNVAMDIEKHYVKYVTYDPIFDNWLPIVLATTSPTCKLCYLT